VRLTLLPLFAAAFPTLAADTPEHVLPMWMQGGHPTVALSLDGQAEPLRFVVDSAAGATLIDGRVARRYGLVDGKADVSTAQGASASGAQLRRTRTTTWQLGSWQLRASALQADLGSLSGGDDPAIDGLVGNDLTARWDTRWDFARGELSLSRTGTLRFDDDSCQANALQDRTEGLRDFGFITLTLDGTNVAAVAVVDTGAAQTVLNNAAAHALGLRTDGSDPRLRKRSKGTEGLGGKAAPDLAVHPARHAQHRLAAPGHGGQDQRAARVQGHWPGHPPGSDPWRRCHAWRPGRHQHRCRADLPAPPSGHVTLGP